MPRRLSLRARLALSFAAFGAFVTVTLTLIVAYGVHEVARRLIDQTLSAEMEDYIARRTRNPHSLPPSAVGLRGYVAAVGEADYRLPAAVRALSVGHHTIELDGASWRVAVAERDGWRYVILFDETGQKRREARLEAWLAGGALIVLMIALAGVWWLAGRALAPLSALAQEIATADVSRPPRLETSIAPGDEIATLAHAFKRYQTRLSHFIERERAFTADASHELRTPLAVIRGAAELLAGDPTLTPPQRERAARIERACLRLGELVDALLLLAREETAAGHCDAAAVAREALERLPPQCQKRQLAVQFAAPPRLALPIAAPLFAILFDNLLRNACEHAHSQIDISLTESALTVRDDGPGMSAEELPRAPERHWRGTQSQGAGIGLALVKRIATLSGFAFRLSNAPEGGFIAEVKFSLQDPASAL